MSAPANARRALIDARVAQFRGTLEALLESLEATVRIARQKREDAATDGLEALAAQLVVRLGAANRLATGKFVGTPEYLAATTAISEAIRRLDNAFVVYRRVAGRGAAEREGAALALDAEIGRVRLEAERWA